MGLLRRTWRILRPIRSLPVISFAATSARSGLNRALDNPALPEFLNKKGSTPPSRIE
jgi:hypothetical protein